MPGRIEQIRTSPTIILDGGHNVNAAEALRKAIEESYDFTQLVGVVAMMGDKQVEEYLGVLEPILSQVVVTENSWRDRVMPAEELEKIAVQVFGRDRVIREDSLPDAIQKAVDMVDVEDETGVGYGRGVLVCGSFVTAGDARTLLKERMNADLAKPRPSVSIPRWASPSRAPAPETLHGPGWNRTPTRTSPPMRTPISTRTTSAISALTRPPRRRMPPTAVPRADRPS